MSWAHSPLWCQVKELGAAVYNCSCLAQDLGKMFEVYWALGLPNTTIPSPWPSNYSTTYNRETPLELKLNGTEAAVYFSVRNCMWIRLSALLRAAARMLTGLSDHTCWEKHPPQVAKMVISAKRLQQGE